MYKNISMTIIIASAIAAFLIVPWAALQHSHAQSNSNLQSTAMNMHDQERRAVNAPALTWSNSLATEAQSWAEHLKALNQGKPLDTITQSDLVHSTTTLGENLAQEAAWGTGPVSPPTTESLIQGWIDEKPYMGGHYTQMIAQSTKEVGCGIASGKGSITDGSMTGESVYLVCRYNPQGNIAAPQAVGEEDAGAQLQEEGAAAPLDDQGAAAPPDGGDDGGGDDGGGDDGGGDDGGGDDGN
jgi:uncharacterized protein YkwD